MSWVWSALYLLRFWLMFCLLLSCSVPAVPWLKSVLILLAPLRPFNSRAEHICPSSAYPWVVLALHTAGLQTAYMTDVCTIFLTLFQHRNKLWFGPLCVLIYAKFSAKGSEPDPRSGTAGFLLVPNRDCRDHAWLRESNHGNKHWASGFLW